MENVASAAAKKAAIRAAEYAVPGAGEVLMAKNAAQGTARVASYGFAFCACIMCIIFMGTLGGWLQQRSLGDKADKKKQTNLKNSWIAFLVLGSCCLILYYAAHASANYKIGGVI